MFFISKYLKSRKALRLNVQALKLKHDISTMSTVFEVITATKWLEKHHSALDEFLYLDILSLLCHRYAVINHPKFKISKD